VSDLLTIIDYRDLWDVPRMFLVRHEGHLYLFDCPFHEAHEDYGPAYRVYRMPELSDADRAGSWAEFPARAVTLLGEVPLTRVRFDPTRRQGVEASVFDHLLTPSPPH
jgi:hypothetical protein